MKERARGPAIWQFRWRDKTSKRLSEDIGTEVEYPSRSAVERCSKVAYLRIKINDDRTPIAVEKFGVVLERWSDIDWPNLSVHVRRAMVSGRLDDVKTECSQAPVPMDPTLAEVILEWRRKKLRHTYRAWLGDNGEPLTVQKELMRHASIQTTLNTYGGGMMESMREAHGRVERQAIAP